ncbi:MAG: BCCT family transporter, partial [Phycisphaerales bacterium JB064]
MDDRTHDEAPPGGDMPSVTLGPHFELHPVVFPAAALIVLGLILATLLVPGDDVGSFFGGIKDWIGLRFGWLYVATMTGLLAFVAWLALSRLGAIKLGGDDEEPEFGVLSWFAMLFSAGMGIGLVFWAVAEPAYHFAQPPPGVAQGLNPSRVSMAVTIFHWGLHPWALYAAVGLGLAYFGFRKKMPLSFRSFLHPIFGDRVWGRLGDAVDVLAIVATLTGVATSLGLGAQQVNAGLGFLFGLPQGTGVQVVLIAAITAIATVSVVLGLSAGIRRLSEVNLVLAFILLIMVVVGGGVVAFLASTVENTGAYLQLLPFNALRTGVGGAKGADWLNSWTVFYWAWWISWSPFVGLFIARISRGRTIRQFVTGVVLVPTLVGIVWLSAFGGSTLRQHTTHTRLATVAQADASEPELPTFTVKA